jgi:ABC-2 type transport system permease protein
MKLAGIVEANLRRLMRDRAALFYTFLLPFLLILILGLIFGGSAVTRVGVAVQDEGPLGDELVAALERSDDLSVRRFSDPDDLVTAVERQELVAGVVVPEDYTRAVSGGRQVKVRFIAEDNQYTPSVRWSLDAAIADQNVELGAAQALAADDPSSFAADLALARATRVRIGAVEVDERTAGDEEREPWGQFELVASQQLVLMVFLVALVAASQLVRTRELGVARRMLASPTRTGTLLAGEALSRFTIALIQAGVIVLITAVAFGVDWGDPPAAAALVTLFALVGTGAAMLVGTLARNESQATAVAIFAALALAAIGGAMQPLEFFSPAMLVVAHLTPHAWALDGFETLIRGGGGIADILIELGALALFALVLLSLATWRLRRSVG